MVATLAEPRAENLVLGGEVLKLKDGATSTGVPAVEAEEDKGKGKGLKRIDRKDVDKPDEYSGNADHLLNWPMSF